MRVLPLLLVLGCAIEKSNGALGPSRVPAGFNETEVAVRNDASDSVDVSIEVDGVRMAFAGIAPGTGSAAELLDEGATLEQVAVAVEVGPGLSGPVDLVEGQLNVIAVSELDPPSVVTFATDDPSRPDGASGQGW